MSMVITNVVFTDVVSSRSANMSRYQMEGQLCDNYVVQHNHPLLFY